MQELSKDELMEVQGGGYGLGLLIASGVVFLVGVIDGIVRPLNCH
ncbi:MAG: bacteriocin [Bacilli bacterium]|nr:bacteriocin [Bacilli bacterium]